MFRCGNCKQVSKAGEKVKRRLVETRNRSYETRTAKGMVYSRGFEIVRDISVGDCCHLLSTVERGQ